MATKLAKIIADFRTTLATEIAVGGTTATLQSNADDDGVTLPNGTYFFTLDGDGTAKEHIVCTNTGGNLTAISTVSRQGVQASGVVRKHRIGASVTITDFAHIKYINDLLDGTTNLNAATPLQYDGTATISNANHLATKAYVDGVAIAGAPDGSTTVKGIFEEATVAEQGTATATGSTGARLIPANANLVKTSSGASDENKIAVLDAAGTFANGFIDKVRTWATAQSFTADNCQITTDPNSANDAVRKSYIDTAVTPAIASGAISGTSGEAITAGQGVYIKASDGKIYRTNGTGDEATFKFVGVALTTVGAADLAVTYAPPGHTVTGLAGLTAGSFYYVTDAAGTLGTTPGTRFARVGLAISTTALLVVLPKYKRTGEMTINATGNFSATTGFYPARIVFRTSVSGGGAMGIGEDDNNAVGCASGNITAITYGGGAAVFSRRESGGPVYVIGSVSARSETDFTVNVSQYGGLIASAFWTAESL